MLKRGPYARGSKSYISITIDHDQCARLDALVTLRRTNRATLIREAIDLYLSHRGVPANSMTDASTGEVAA
jgi:metal-responsive CopG/Arc/MetJ family transcriptional regulator